MVTNVTSLTGNGLKDWLLQRVSAAYLAVYFLGLFFYLFFHHPLDYPAWHDLFQLLWIQLASSLAILMIVIHAWIGIWTVTTDYLNCTVIRLSTQTVVGLFLIVQLFWGFKIVWGQ